MCHPGLNMPPGHMACGEGTNGGPCPHRNCLGGKTLRPGDSEILVASGWPKRAGSKIGVPLTKGVPGGDEAICWKVAVRGRTRRSPDSTPRSSLSGRLREGVALAFSASRLATALSCVALSRSALELMVAKVAVPPPKIPACGLAPIGCLRAYRPDMSMLEGDILVCDGAAVPIFLLEADEGRTEWPGFQSGDPDMASEDWNRTKAEAHTRMAWAVELVQFSVSDA